MVKVRDDKLDKLLNNLVKITFTDGDEKTGVLEFDMPYKTAGLPSHMYSIFVFGEGYTFFRKSHVKRVEEWQEK